MTEFEEVEDLSDSIWGLAKEASKASPMNFRLGAVITDKSGRVLVSAYNTYKTHPIWGSEQNDYRHMHAECHALYQLSLKGINPRGTVMYVYRKNGYNAKPCRHCEKMIRKSGVSKVIYTNVEPVRKIKKRKSRKSAKGVGICFNRKLCA